MGSLALIGLAVIPLGARALAKRWLREWTNTATGVGFGLVVAPLSLGLYSTYFLGPLGIVTGMAGLISSMFHGTPGYYICLWLGILPERVVVLDGTQICVAITNGLFWAFIYGLLGSFVDKRRNQKLRSNNSFKPKPLRGSA